MAKTKKAVKRCLQFYSFVAVITLTGCAAMANFKIPGKAKAPPPPLSVQSRMDSLVMAGLPVDTLILEKTESGNLSFQRELILAGPSTVVAGDRKNWNGYRVQLASSEQRRDLESLVQRVERELEKKAYIEVFDGRYCLRIGDFTGRTEAEELRMRAVTFGYKHAWVVQTAILPPR